jgi:uncharacterized membrane protein
VPEVTEQVEETAENVKDGAINGAHGVLNGDGLGKVVVPGALAATAAAVAYAAYKGAPKLKDSVSSKAADTAEDVAEGALDKAKQKGGVAGAAAKLVGGGGGGGNGGGGGGMLGSIASKVMPGGGKDKEPSEGWGKGRRNPIQLVADVGVPVREAYNQWTMLEEFPKFMHRVTSVQVDEDDRSKVKWAEKIWFSKRQWEAEITEMIPDKRIAWHSVSGTKHVGHVTFHPLEDELTRVVVNLDFNPSGMIEKMASGMRFVKRAAKSDVYRYKAFIETHEQATGAWRGRIEDGEVVEDAEVEEGKPFEEGQELRRPEGSGKQSEMKDKDGDEDDEEDEGEEEQEDSRDQDELQAQREERQQRRQERRQEIGSAS